MISKNTLILGSLILLLSSCNNNNLNKNLEELDKIYGCDNPHRQYNDVQYQICKDKERAGQKQEPFNLSDLLNRSKEDQVAIYKSAVNQNLWMGSLGILKDYSLKIADSDGGYIETDWIYENQNRCLIKIQITSAELISTGVDTKILCQKNNNDLWVNDNVNYINEEKKLTLKILESANLNSQFN